MHPSTSDAIRLKHQGSFNSEILMLWGVGMKFFPLARTAMRECRWLLAAIIGLAGCQKPISSSWKDLSFDINASSHTNETWTGCCDYGSPIQMDERTVAIIERRSGLEFALWHLDFIEGSLRFVVALNKNRTEPSGYDGVVWHREGEDIVGEFVMVHTRVISGGRYQGNSLIGEINLRTGAAKVDADKVKHVISKADAIKKLLDKRRDRKTAIELPKASQVKGVVAASLAKKGMAFDWIRGRLVVSDEARQKLVKGVNDLNDALSDGRNNAVSMLRDFEEEVTGVPGCPATRELLNRLRLLEEELR
jgi:hypothetical protein